MSALLHLSGLTAHYGDFQALFGIDLTLEDGETLAIIGANGAGKTTLMRAITGVAKVTAGTAHLRHLSRWRGGTGRAGAAEGL